MIITPENRPSWIDGDTPVLAVDLNNIVDTAIDSQQRAKSSEQAAISSANSAEQSANEASSATTNANSAISIANQSKSISEIAVSSANTANEQSQSAKQIATSVENRANLGEFDGYSAYEVAVNNGFVGTEAEWLESLKGSIDIPPQTYGALYANYGELEFRKELAISDNVTLFGLLNENMEFDSGIVVDRISEPGRTDILMVADYSVIYASEGVEISSPNFVWNQKQIATVDDLDDIKEKIESLPTFFVQADEPTTAVNGDFWVVP